MFKKSSILRTTVLLSAAIFVVLGLFPLASTAFRHPMEPETEIAVQLPGSPPAAPDNGSDQPEVDILGADPVTPLPPGLPVYDPDTFSEREKAGLPTALPSVKPYYREKTVYLTFDDGPDPDNTPVILDILRQYGVKATFFLIGTEVEKYPVIVRQIYREGHAIGNHSYTHVYRDLYRSAAAYTSQLNRTDDAIKKAIGVRPRISRAPGGSAGSFTTEYWQALRREGYVEIGWNVIAGDASRARADQLVANTVRQVDGNQYLWDHAIVLLHDGRGHTETVRALPDIITFFQDRGFEFRVVNLETPPAW